jgi:dGTPase
LLERFANEAQRPDDWRTPFAKDKARIIHSAAFRRLQGKTQVMGSGEGDFHRTRLTHTLEVAQLGTSLAKGMGRHPRLTVPPDLKPFMDDLPELIGAACFGHDIGHPPFGHGGERALHKKMAEHGGFEGNAQNILLLTRLEKYHISAGINPTRRTLLAILKYPLAFSWCPGHEQQSGTPPKCYYDESQPVIDWATACFSDADRKEFFRFATKNGKTRSIHTTFDCSIMEFADDAAYATHDLEDIVARGLVKERDVIERAEEFLRAQGGDFCKHFDLGIADFKHLFGSRHELKTTIGKFVNLILTHAQIKRVKGFEYPLLANRMTLPSELKPFVKFLKQDIAYKLVISRPEIAMLERKGQRIIEMLFDEFSENPGIIPHHGEDRDEKNVRSRCNYIAGMTDHFADSIYQRLFLPGFGNSRDEM